jgi:hypothetical protein
MTPVRRLLTLLRRAWFWWWATTLAIALPLWIFAACDLVEGS